MEIELKPGNKFLCYNLAAEDHIKNNNGFYENAPHEFESLFGLEREYDILTKEKLPRLECIVDIVSIDEGHIVIKVKYDDIFSETKCIKYEDFPKDFKIVEILN